MADSKLSQKRIGVLERIGGSLIDPEATFRAMVEDQISVGGALLAVIVFSLVEGFALGSIASTLKYFTSFASQWLSFAGGQLGWLTLLAWLIIPAVTFAVVVGNLIFWVFSSWIAHISAKYIFGGEGSFTEVLTSCGYSWSAVMPFLAGVALTTFSGNMIFLTVLTPISLAWFLVSWVTAIKTVHGIDAGRGFVSAFIIPLTVYVLIAVTLFYGSLGVWLT